jgi:NAD(P)-dependent dehydrogenase (short-subunit alcohol dehydrogenase family)
MRRRPASRRREEMSRWRASSSPGAQTALDAPRRMRSLTPDTRLFSTRDHASALRRWAISRPILTALWWTISKASDTRSIADQVNAIGRMDAVIHNAGIYTEQRRGSTPEGHATILAVNTLAPYMLTALIERPARLIYLSSGLHRGGQASLKDLDWIERPWDTARAYAESKLHVAALALAISRRWPDVLSNAVDPGWVRTRMGGSGAPVDIDTGQRTQTWLAVSNDPEALVSGHYWHDLRPEQPAREVLDTKFQDQLIARLGELTGVELP